MVTFGRAVARAGVGAVVLPLALVTGGPAGSGEPEPDRHSWLQVSCNWDRATVRARTEVRTADMKNNNDARLPRFYKIRTTTKIQRQKGSFWRTVDTEKWQSKWLERKGVWIIKRHTPPPFTPQNSASGRWIVGYGDTTRLVNPGDTIRAKVTVKLDKMPGLSQWKYTRKSSAEYCDVHNPGVG